MELRHLLSVSRPTPAISRYLLSTRNMESVFQPYICAPGYGCFFVAREAWDSGTPGPKTCKTFPPCLRCEGRARPASVAVCLDNGTRDFFGYCLTLIPLDFFSESPLRWEEAILARRRRGSMRGKVVCIYSRYVRASVQRVRIDALWKVTRR